MARFLAGLFIVLVLVLCAIYAAGWMNFGATDNSATIEIKTGEIKEAAKDASRRAEQLVEDSQKAIERATTDSPPPNAPSNPEATATDPR